MNNFSPEDDQITRVTSEQELKKYKSEAPPNSPSMSVVYDTPLAKPARVKDVADKNYSSQTGIPLSHPLDLMTLILSENSWADLAVKTISASCASTDPLFQVYSLANGRNKEKAASRKIEMIVEKLLYPNAHQTGYEFFLTIYENLAAYGNAYVQVVRTKGGEIHSLYTLPPETIRIIPYQDKYGILHCAYYQTDSMAISAKKEGTVFLEHEIIHFKDTNEKSFLYGKPRLYSLITHITSNSQATTAVNSWLEKGFAGGAVFRMEGSDEVIDRNREFIRENYSGASNYGQILLLQGSAELLDAGQKFVGNLNFEKLSATGRDTILTCMGVPVSMAGVRSDAGMGNAEIVASEEKAFKRNVVDKMHEIVFGKIQQKLIREFLDEKQIAIKAGVLSKFSLNDSINAVRALSELGISLKEAREMLGMRALDVDEMNNLWIIKTNNGAIRFEDILGVDPLTGDEVPTLIDQAMAQESATTDNTKTNPEKKVKELTGGSTGLGNDLKKKVEGK